MQPRLVICRFKAFDLRLSRFSHVIIQCHHIKKFCSLDTFHMSSHFKSIFIHVVFAARRAPLFLAVMIATAWRDTCQSCEPLWLVLRVELCVARLVDVFFSESNHICLRSTRPKGHGRRVPQRKGVPSHAMCALAFELGVGH